MILFFYFHFYLFNFFWPHRVACGILVPQPGIEPAPPALAACSVNHWTAREVPIWVILRADSEKSVLGLLGEGDVPVSFLGRSLSRSALGCGALRGCCQHGWKQVEGGGGMAFFLLLGP